MHGSVLQRGLVLNRIAPALDVMKSHDDERLQLADLVVSKAGELAVGERNQVVGGLPGR